jgi:NAD dependent epimerase/dehydratase family enzyme
MVSPNPVTNAEFTSILAKVLRRPAILPVPAFAARIALGQLADEALLASARVEPKAVLNSGFSFRFPQLESALRDLL